MAAEAESTRLRKKLHSRGGHLDLADANRDGAAASAGGQPATVAIPPQLCPSPRRRGPGWHAQCATLWMKSHPCRGCGLRGHLRGCLCRFTIPAYDACLPAAPYDGSACCDVINKTLCLRVSTVPSSGHNFPTLPSLLSTPRPRQARSA